MPRPAALLVALSLAVASSCGPADEGGDGPATGARPAGSAAPQAPPATVPPPGTLVASLDGTWDVLLDPGDDGRLRGLPSGTGSSWDGALPIQVPGALETHPDSVGYDGIAWYRRRLPAAAAPDGERLLLVFDGVNYRADVWLGGEHLLRHDGSDARFRVDVSGRLDADGTPLVVRVVDPGRERVDGLVLGALPHAKESWYYNYGGITGSVRLLAVGDTEVLSAELDVHARFDATLRLHLFHHGDGPGRVPISARLGAPASGADAGAASDGTGVTRTDTGGAITLRFRTEAQLDPGVTTVEWPVSADQLRGLARWSPDAPVRHPITVAVDGETLHEGLVGIRRFAVNRTHFELDGEPFVIRSVLYQPYFPRSLAVPPSASWLADELTAIKDAGFNMVRVHLRTLPDVYAVCDEIGLLVHAEPTLGWITERDEQTLPAVDKSLVAFGDAVRGHPSVVMVGLLNEMSGELAPHTTALSWRLHELLPGRLVLDDSGSWQGSAHYANPGADTFVPYDDLHVYRAWPFRPEDLAEMSALGADHDRLVFVSEYGFGGIPALEGNLADFGSRVFYEDAQDYLGDLEAASRQITDGPLRGLVEDVAQLSALGQANQARAARVAATRLRANPRVAGDCYTQWRDAAWENGAGLVDVWGAPKPALAELVALNAIDGRPTVEDEAPLPARSLGLVATGPRLALDPALAAIVDPLVSPDDDGESLPRLGIVGARPSMWTEENIAATLTVLRYVRAGGTVLLLAPPDAGRPLPNFFFGYDGFGQVSDLPFDIAARPARGHFVGTHFVFREDSPLLDDIPDTARLLDERFGAALPARVLAAADELDAEVELACLDGYGLYRGGVVQSVPYGEGRLLLSTLRFDEESLTEPVVRRLLENLVRWAADVAARRQAPPMPVVGRIPAGADAIGRDLWRLKIFFGLAERLAIQQFNGRRPVRRELNGLPYVVHESSAALDAIVAGAMDRGATRLMALADVVMSPDHERFLRKEIALSEAFFQPGGAVQPRDLAENIRVGAFYARALATMRDGRADEALAELEHGLRYVESLRETPR